MGARERRGHVSHDRVGGDRAGRRGHVLVRGSMGRFRAAGAARAEADGDKDRFLRLLYQLPIYPDIGGMK